MTEIGVISEGKKAGQVVVRISPKYFRPAEVGTSLGFHYLPLFTPKPLYSVHAAHMST